MLPTFRRRIFSSMLRVVGVLAAFGVVLIAALGAAGGVPPALVRLNYDSIEAADQMKEAWNALGFPGRFLDLTPAQAVVQFNQALAFEEGNLTEAGEAELAAQIHSLWQRQRTEALGLAQMEISASDFATMHRLLGGVIKLNEKGMFQRVATAKQINFWTLVAAGVVLVVTALFAAYLADGFATRLASPIKGLAEALQARPGLDRPLKLPPPTNIELRILIREVRRLWDSLAATHKLNIAQIVAQKSRLETLLASVEDAFLVLDSSGVVSHCNHLMQEIIGLPAAEIIGCAWNDLPTLTASYLMLRERFALKDEQESETELEAAGKTYNFTLRSRRIVGKDGEAVGRLILLRDITEKRQRQRLKAELIDLLSHELKTPVQSLGMAAEMLARRKEAFEPSLRFFVETINEDVARIRAVAQQFIQASQTQAKTMRIDLKRVALSDVLSDWLKPFVIIAKAKGVSLSYEVLGGGVRWAKVDPIKLPWAISNLLSNAIRVSTLGATVAVTIMEEGAKTVIAVSDSGPGIAPAVERRMYEPFFQGPEEGGVERGMLGVGLTIAKEVVEAHDGQLVYQRREPCGSVFRIELPTPPVMEGVPHA